MKIYIAEDEPLAAAKLKLFLEKADAGGDITLFGDGRKLLEAIGTEGAPDVIFLDIQMPHLTGIQFLEAMQAQPHRSEVIITSAYDKFAIDGFNFGVTDYLLKPYTLDRLKQALGKLRVTQTADGNNQSDSPIRNISVRCEGRTEVVQLQAIICVEAQKDYAAFVLTDGRRLMVLGTLSAVEQMLPADTFMRVHRSYVVNLSHVQSYNSQTIRLSSGLEIPLGKTYREAFERH